MWVVLCTLVHYLTGVFLFSAKKKPIPFKFLHFFLQQQCLNAWCEIVRVETLLPTVRNIKISINSNVIVLFSAFIHLKPKRWINADKILPMQSIVNIIASIGQNHRSLKNLSKICCQTWQFRQNPHTWRKKLPSLKATVVFIRRKKNTSIIARPPQNKFYAVKKDTKNLQKNVQNTQRKNKCSTYHTNNIKLNVMMR